MLPDTTEVLIIGAGPTGMVLSIVLHQAGVDHVLIDRLEQGLQTSRAGVIHAQTLESLEPLGVTQRLERTCAQAAEISPSATATGRCSSSTSASFRQNIPI